MGLRARLAAALFGLAMLGWAPTPTHAAGEFTVTPTLPANQRKDTSGYFDLLVRPKQKQTLTVALTNRAATDADFEVWANPAVTSDNGAIDYTQRKQPVDQSVPLDFRRCVTIPKHRYSVAAKGKVRIPVTLTLPAKRFAGRVLGGLNVLRRTPKQEGKINNQIGYSLAIVLQQTTEPVAPDLKLIGAGPKAVNHHTTLALTWRNPAATIIPNLKFHTVITRNGKAFMDNHANPYQVAPNTRFHLNLGLADARVLPGDYRVKVVATSGKFFKRTFTRRFKVTRAAADKVNRNTLHQPEPDNPWRTALLVLLVVLVLGVGVGWWQWRRHH